MTPTNSTPVVPPRASSPPHRHRESHPQRGLPRGLWLIILSSTTVPYVFTAMYQITHKKSLFTRYSTYCFIVHNKSLILSNGVMSSSCAIPTLRELSRCNVTAKHDNLCITSLVTMATSVWLTQSLTHIKKIMYVYDTYWMQGANLYLYGKM